MELSEQAAQELAEGSTAIGRVAELEARVAELEAQGGRAGGTRPPVGGREGEGRGGSAKGEAR